MVAAIPEIENVSILTPLDDPYYQWRACAKCNVVYKCGSNNAATLCPDCQRVVEKNSRPSTRGLRKEAGHPVYFVVVFDPTGDFSPGNVFETSNWCMSLYSGAWAVGMQAQCQGITYTVTGMGTMEDDQGGKYRATIKKIERVE